MMADLERPFRLRGGSNARRLLWMAVPLGLACGADTPGPMLDLPERPADATEGAVVLRDIRDLDLEEREERIYAEVARGNVPGWLRQLVEVEMTREIDGREHQVIFSVTPDYLAVGSDSSFFLAPLSPQTAQRIADLVGGSLPTPRMVDAAWRSAKVQLAPIRIEPDEFMTTVRYYERHDRLVAAQRGQRGLPPGTFVAGHKLDVVLSATLSATPGRVALYGWHRTDGQPIQRLYTGHDDDWVAFSHGIRIVGREILVDGVRRDLRDVLRDPDLAELLSDEGVIAEPWYPIQRAEEAIEGGAGSRLP